MAHPPWASASNDDLNFILITGANSGVGLGIGQRTIDKFLDTRPPSQHLILIPTTRSKTKSHDTVLALRKHLQNNPKHSSPARVHILSLQLDLCDLRSIYAAADQLINGTVSDPTGQLDDVAIPRIDAALFNAGIGGWSGLSWFGLVYQFARRGISQATCFPAFKIAANPVILDSQKLLGANTAPKFPPPALTEVFTANLFGHYVLAHQLLPLLSRSSASEAPGRVVWTSSIDAGFEHLDLGDFQATRTRPPYESSKRITDIIALTAELPSVRDAAAPFFDSPAAADKPIKSRFYLSHPGIVCTPIFPLNWFLFLGYQFAMYLARWFGSPWHTIKIYLGACATTWLALADQSTLDALDAQRVKWGSSATFFGHAAPKKTETEGWGWEGRIEDDEALRNDPEKGIFRKSRFRKWDAITLTEEKKAEFEAQGRQCWEKLESLRVAWDAALKQGKA
ncbi:hypothetical protein F5Y16DRAFT_371785 [Xylariaceae sp. FL0255]|nr:hypothetical protein F5Y16DRAFT_371785 [Xylariaceae sp. FL0255]